MLSKREGEQRGKSVNIKNIYIAHGYCGRLIPKMRWTDLNNQVDWDVMIVSMEKDYRCHLNR